MKNNISRVPIYRITARKEANGSGVSGSYVVSFRALIAEQEQNRTLKTLNHFEC